ncbi:hypothetical protein MHH52_23260 [Paenibacillus sp. FSL K6-0276]|uniref:hypothetical protein n=1 Tax=Paenibacillus sp. FSL K6-0276 TaxID=2921450 RepID=UPI0030EB17DF
MVVSDQFNGTYTAHSTIPATSAQFNGTYTALSTISAASAQFNGTYTAYSTIPATSAQFNGIYTAHSTVPATSAKPSVLIPLFQLFQPVTRFPLHIINLTQFSNFHSVYAHFYSAR